MDSRPREEWVCHRSGECCQHTHNLLLTVTELAEMRRIVPSITPDVSVAQTPGFLILKGRPCPYLARDHRQRWTCRVHGVRPYNCRRYMCGRMDIRVEPFDDRPIPLPILSNRHLRRQYERNQRHAQRWALSHGWQPEMRHDAHGS